MAPEEMLVVKKHGKRKAIRRPGGEILVRQVDKDGWEALEGRSPLSPPDQQTGGKDKEIMCFSTRPVEQFEVLNDLVVDRGPSPFVSLLEIFGDDHHLTTVQADGLTVSTPTGSTAYSLSAGGSLVHPQIPALLLTPICPHTLSFRPMLLPDSMELRICVPYNSRSTAWASFDGRGRVELKQGDHIKITASKYPFPTVCADKQSTDWF
jgi:NAD+ kinase